jgi:4-alpha-glucanotransferase
MATDDWGIDDGWWSSDHEWVSADPDTVALLRGAMSPSGPGPLIVRAGATDALDAPTEVVLEDGTALGELRSLPPDLPLGYHALVDEGAVERDLIVVPGWLDVWPPRCWGVVAQLYSLPSPNRVGNVATLERLGGWVAERGGRVIGLNPFGDPIPVTPREPSPYSTSSREHLDPLLVDLTRLGVEAPPATASALIDRDRAWSSVRAALERAWRDAGCPHPARPRSHAVFSALAEHHGRGWRSWPDEHRHPDGPAVAAFAREHADLVALWQWIDDVVESQVRDVAGALGSSGITLMGDLPVGVSAEGYDAWIDQDLLLSGMRIGAPPDTFNPDGQNWQLPCFDPHRLRSSGYRPFVRMVRANLARFGGLRVDHIMGLFRLYCIPQGASPRHGTYIRFPATDLVDLLALEAHRARAFVVGEDLGTVEDQVRQAMAERGLGGTRVVLFEEGDPGWWPERSLATVTTHDLPTIRGALEHSDPRLDERLVEHIRWFAGAHEGDEPQDVAVATHGRLAASGSGIALVTLEDLTWSADRVNLPGTIDEHPNWRIPLDESRLHDDFAGRLVAAMREHRTGEG